MKGKKYGIIVSIVIMIISVPLMLLFAYNQYLQCELLQNVFIGILGSSLVTLIISPSDYIVLKRESLENYYSQVYKIIFAFGKIKYFPITDEILASAQQKTKSNLGKCFEVNNEESEDISSVTERNCSNIIKAMNSYLEFDSLSFEEVENAYGRISFLSDKSKKHPYEEKYFNVWIFRNLHEKLRNMINTIRIENYHFKLFKDGEANNIYVIAQKISELNNKLFDIKSEPFGEDEIQKVYAGFYNEMNINLEKFRPKIYNCEANKQMIAPISTIIRTKENSRSENNDKL